MTTTPCKYLLEMTIIEGTNELPFLCPGLFVQTSVDGALNIEDNTEIVRSSRYRTVWNRRLAYEFPTLEADRPKVISLSVLRKRTVHQNYKLVGTARFSTAELMPIINKGTIERKLMIYVPYQDRPTGTLTISVSLRRVAASSVTAASSKTSSLHTTQAPYEIDETEDEGIVMNASLANNFNQKSKNSEVVPQLSLVFHVVFVSFIILSFVIYERTMM